MVEDDFELEDFLSDSSIFELIDDVGKGALFWKMEGDIS